MEVPNVTRTEYQLVNIEDVGLLERVAWNT
jgi:hypothetical protein